MIVGAAFLVGVVVMATQAHRPLQRLVRGNWDSRFAIACWLLALGSVILTSTAAVYLLTHAGHGSIETLLDELGRCWATVQHAAAPSMEQTATLSGTALLILLGTRLTWCTLRQNTVRRQRSDKLQFLLSMATNAAGTNSNIRWLDHSEPLAFSVAGRPGVIAVSRGLKQALSPRALGATLEHERAHLRGRHHLLLDIVDAGAAAFPWAPLFRAAPAAIRELVELAADDAAAAFYGAKPVVEALHTLTSAPTVDGGLFMAGTAVSRRLARLGSDAPRKFHARRNLWCAAAALTIPLLPAILGAALVLSVGCM